MKLLLAFITQVLIFSVVVYAEDIKVDNLLEKVQQANTKEEKKVLIIQLKKKLATINKKARLESNAIIDAKKKLPSSLFNEKIVK